MRPVDKWKAPDAEFEKYQDAEPYLEERLGPYCSFCEYPIHHVPEVEHRESKARGGEELDWDNLLLSCKYCNTRKGKVVGKGEKEKYLWPDQDDTFHAFLYDETGVPKLHDIYLEKQGTDVKEKAQALFELLKLDNVPIKPTDKDRRFKKRSEVWNNAVNSKNTWGKIKETDMKKDYLETIEMLAKESGFFSVWMTVFEDDIEVREMLIHTFKGTRREYCVDREV